MSGIDLVDLLTCVIKPALHTIGLYSPSAAVLIAGTYLVEGYAGGVAHLKQVRGPAVGLWQMEEPTYDDCFVNYLDSRPDLRRKVSSLALNGVPDFQQMAGNLYLACAMARIKYLRSPVDIPAVGDADGYASYHKIWYNSAMGAANPDVNRSMFASAAALLGDKL